MFMIEVTAADDRGVCYNFGGDCYNFGSGCCNFCRGCCNFGGIASFGVLVAVFAKNKGPEFDIFFPKIQKRHFFPF